MSKSAAIFATCLIVVMTACGSGMEVQTEIEPDADFSGYKTWNWLPNTEEPTDPRIADPVVQQRIRKAIETRLAQNGFQLNTSDPDFLVFYHAAVKDNMSTTMVDDRYDNASYAGYTRNWDFNYTHVWLQGTLIIDILDATTVELVWRGSAEAELKENATDEEKDKRVREAVEKLLKHFPPDK